MKVDEMLVVRILESAMSNKTGAVSWVSLGKPAGFIEAVEYIQQNNLADDVNFWRGKAKENSNIRGAFMRVNQKGKQFIEKHKAP